MSSFIFDDFKKRFLTGGVPKTDSWYFIPVNDTFETTYEHDDIKLYHYRNINDFKQANSAGFNFNLSQDAKKINANLEQLYFKKGLKGTSLDCKKNWQPLTIYGNTLLDGSKIQRTWSKVLNDDDLSNKPMYIKGGNSGMFYNLYGNNVSGNNDIKSYIQSGGFYYIRSKDELTWFANRSNTGNNKIIGVLGDNIEGVINGDPIGKNESNPFQGILDGNGFTLRNISVECNNTDNGLVGVLGKYGVVKNFNIENENNVNSLVCKKYISLKHIKEDARDINAGILVGRNYGTISNINALNLKHFNFNGFVPEVYSVTNKSDDNSWTDGKVRKKFDTSNSNYYFMNHFCINSPGNICPYVGYFAEGYYGEDHFEAAKLLFSISGSGSSAVAVPEMLTNSTITGSSNELKCFMDENKLGYKIWNKAGHNPIRCFGDKLTAFDYYTLNENLISNDITDSSNNWNSYLLSCKLGQLSAIDSNVEKWITDGTDQTFFNVASTMAKWPVYYGLDNKGYYTCGLITSPSATDDHGGYGYYVSATKLCYNTNIIQDTLNLDNDAAQSAFDAIICPSAYLQTSIRMNPLTRAAYNVGIIAGANYGSISNVGIKVTAQNTSNFVGFFGTVAGKQANGKIDTVSVDVDNQFIWDGLDNSYNVTYKNTPILPQCLKKQFSFVQVGSALATNTNFDYYFSAFYDSDPSVNTATDITDDCVTYKLKPIIIAGGLFGRYIPTLDSEFKQNQNWLSTEGCQINNTTVIYADNFEDTNVSSTDYKRIENAMGIIAGKCDAGTQSIGIDENQIIGTNRMFVSNSVFSAASRIGPTVEAYPMSGDYSAFSGSDIETYKTQGSGLKFCEISGNTVKTDCTSKYIGVYEIKQNVLETMCIGIDKENGMTTADNLQIGKDTDYLFTCDYPFKIKNGEERTDEGSFYPNHNFANWMNPESRNNPGVTIPNGMLKRYIASWLLHLENCLTNISPAIVLYDDFLNTWYNPKYLQPNTSGTYWSCNGNFFSKKAWTRPLSSDESICEYIADVYKNETSLTSILNIDDYAATRDIFECQAIQNTFDGYTFIRTNGAYGAPDSEGNIDDVWNDSYFLTTPNPLTRSNFEAWFNSTNTYNNPRQYEKNILVWSSPELCPFNYDNISGYNFGNTNSLVGVPYLTATTTADTICVTDSVLVNKNIFNRNRKDDFFYYTYNNTDVKYYPNNIPQNINDSLAKEENVTFGVYDERMGYFKKVPSEKIPYNYSYYGVGESLSPVEIRNKINLSGTFTTTAISSNQNFGGLLVIDTSGNNVMFLENANGSPLTGNVVTYPTSLLDAGKELLLLEVQ